MGGNGERETERDRKRGQKKDKDAIREDKVVTCIDMTPQVDFFIISEHVSACMGKVNGT